jgi:hypothetical protein
MFVTVRIPIEAPVQLYHLPPESLRPGGTIWLVREGRLQVVQVSLLQMTAGEAVVYPVDQQFAAGDRVVISPLAAIQDGMQVQLLEGQR